MQQVSWLYQLENAVFGTKQIQLFRLVVRHGIVMSVAFALPFFPTVQDWSGGSIALIPVNALTLGLVPVAATSVGSEIALCFNGLLSLPIFVALLFMKAYLFPYSLTAFVVTSSLVVFTTMYLGFSYPRLMLPCLLNVIAYSILGPSLYSTFNFDDTLDSNSERLEEAKTSIVGLVVSVAIPYTLHCIASLIFYPWSAAKVFKWNLHDRWLVQASLIRSLRGVYGTIAEDTLFPQEQFLSLDDPVLENLKAVRDQEIATLISCQSQLMAVLLETRWTFSGKGALFIEKQSLTRHCTRLARSAADDLLQKYERLKREHEEFPSAQPSDLIPDQLEHGGVWKESSRRRYLKQLGELSNHLEICCRPLSMLMVLDRDSQAHAFNASVEFLRKRQALMDAVWLEIEERTLSWGGAYLQQIAKKYSLETRMNKEEPLKKTKLFTYVIHLGKLVSAFKEAWEAIAVPTNGGGDGATNDTRVGGRIDLFQEEIKKDPRSLYSMNQRHASARTTASGRGDGDGDSTATSASQPSSVISSVYLPLSASSHSRANDGEAPIGDGGHSHGGGGRCGEIVTPLALSWEMFWKQDFVWEWTVTLSPWSTSNVVDMQLPASSLLKKKRKQRSQGCSSLWVHRFDQLQSVLNSIPFKVALKFSFGTTLISLLSYLPATYATFGDIQLFQGIFAFQVILYRLYLGLVFERTFQRLAGVCVGYLYLGVCWEFVQQIAQSAWNGWLLFVLGVPLVWLYVWIIKAKPRIGYIGFAFVRTYAVLVGPLLLEAAGESPESLKDGYWVYGAWALLSTLIGAILAVSLGILVWPTSGRKSLKLVLANIYRDFILVTEGAILYNYYRPSKKNAAEYGSGWKECPELSLAESHLAIKVHTDTGILLRAAQLESIEYTAFDATVTEYTRAVQCTKKLWHALWKLHHIGGLRLLTSSELSTLALPKWGEQQKHLSMNYGTLRLNLGMHRLFTSAFSTVACTLMSTDPENALPVLDPVVASPSLLAEMLHDFLVQCYSDEELMKSLVASRDLDLLANLIIFRDVVLDIGESLKGMYQFIRMFSLDPVFGESLQDADDTTFSRYAKKK
jgi:hypothetical protein